MIEKKFPPVFYTDFWSLQGCVYPSLKKKWLMNLELAEVQSG